MKIIQIASENVDVKQILVAEISISALLSEQSYVVTRC